MPKIKPLLVVFVGIAAHCLCLENDHLILIPENIEVIFIGQHSIFICKYLGKQNISFRWIINGFSETSPFNETISCDNQTMNITSESGSILRESTLIMITPPSSCNNTEVQCQASLLKSNTTQLSLKRKLILQGVLDQPTNLQAKIRQNIFFHSMRAGNFTAEGNIIPRIVLSWDAPFSLHPIFYADDEIHFSVIVERPGDSVENHTTTKTSYELDFDVDTDHQAYTFNVTANNPAGTGGTASTVQAFPKPYCTTVDLHFSVQDEKNWLVEFPVDWPIKDLFIVVKSADRGEERLRLGSESTGNNTFVLHGRHLALNEFFNMSLSVIEESAIDAYDVNTGTENETAACDITITIPILKKIPTAAATATTTYPPSTESEIPSPGKLLTIVDVEKVEVTKDKNSLSAIVGGTAGASAIVLGLASTILTSAVYVKWRHRVQPRYQPRWLLNILSLGTIYCLRKIQDGTIDLDEIVGSKQATTEL